MRIRRIVFRELLRTAEISSIGAESAFQSDQQRRHSKRKPRAAATEPTHAKLNNKLQESCVDPIITARGC